MMLFNLYECTLFKGKLFFAPLTFMLFAGTVLQADENIDDEDIVEFLISHDDAKSETDVSIADDLETFVVKVAAPILLLVLLGLATLGVNKLGVTKKSIDISDTKKPSPQKPIPKKTSPQKPSPKKPNPKKLLDKKPETAIAEIKPDPVLTTTYRECAASRVSPFSGSVDNGKNGLMICYKSDEEESDKGRWKTLLFERQWTSQAYPLLPTTKVLFFDEVSSEIDRPLATIRMQLRYVKAEEIFDFEDGKQPCLKSKEKTMWKSFFRGRDRQEIRTKSAHYSLFSSPACFKFYIKATKITPKDDLSSLYRDPTIIPNRFGAMIRDEVKAARKRRG